MIVDQSEIDKLLGGEAPVEEATPQPPPEPASTEAAPAIDVSRYNPDVQRLLQLRVPVIVRLAQRRISVHDARTISLGLIIEFEKPVGEPLELLVNNRRIAEGEAVKVAEHFGIRIKRIDTAADRIRAMGK